MEQPNSRVILDKRPKGYHKQGLTYCGGYSAQAILEAYGKEVPDHSRKLYYRWLGRVIGLPSSPSDWEQVFAQHGLQAESKRAINQSPEERLHLLKSLLSEHVPVMIRIGNGYGLDGKHRRWQQKLIGHWITAWGFDDEEQVFYVYDSAIPLKLYDRNIPIGNKKRTYQEMLRDWEGSWTPPHWSHLYIAVRCREEIDSCLRAR